MMNFESPMGMSFSLSQLGGVYGGVPMASGMSGFSGLGMMSQAGALSSEEEERTLDEKKAKRLEKIIEKVKSRPGKVTLENVKMLGEEYKYDVDEEPKLREGKINLNLGGSHVTLEVWTSTALDWNIWLTKERSPSIFSMKSSA